jgi:hypothetical protein
MPDPIERERPAIHAIYAETIGAINKAKLSPLAFYTLAGVILSQAIMEASEGNGDLARELVDQTAASTRAIVNSKFGH